MLLFRAGRTCRSRRGEIKRISVRTKSPPEYGCQARRMSASRCLPVNGIMRRRWPQRSERPVNVAVHRNASCRRAGSAERPARKLNPLVSAPSAERRAGQNRGTGNWRGRAAPETGGAGVGCASTSVEMAPVHRDLQSLVRSGKHRSSVEQGRNSPLFRTGRPGRS